MLSLGIAAGMAPRPADAGPQGTVVVGGSVDVRQSGTHTEFTQHTSKALLNHNSFDIQANESVNFAQPSASALAVNRVVGSDLPTRIAGQLTANGNVWVLNPSGVAIQGTAQVNVGGLLATTASIGDEAILAGERHFAGAPAGSVVSNAGTINAQKGSVVLVAPVVSNSGTISTSGSDVALGAGSGFTVDFAGDGLTRFEVEPASGVTLANSGTISAQGGAALISAASAAAVQTSVVSIGGRVEATRLEQKGGVIHISGGDAGATEVSGTLDARQTAGDGGRIVVTGDVFDIKGTAVIDASGAAAGGSVELGGGIRGGPIDSPVLSRAGAPASAPLPTAKGAVVREGARIAANAGREGDGGTVIVWSEEATVFRGLVEARGGATSGDGGFAEISSGRGIVFDGAADLTARDGITGTLLLDPETVTIVADAGGETDGSVISAAALADSVAAANTLIEATQSIRQDADVALSGDNSLTYRTESGDVTLNAALDGAGNAFFIEAGGAVMLSDLRVAALSVEAGGSIGQQPGSAIAVSGATDLAAAGDIALAEAGNRFSTVDLAGSGIEIVDQNAIVLGQISATSLAVTAGGTITDTNGKTITVTGTSDLTARSGGTFFDIVLDGAGAPSGGHNFSSSARFAAQGEDITVVDASGIQLGNISANAADAVVGNGNDGDLTVLAGGAITQTGGTTIDVSGDSVIATSSGSITLARATNDFADSGSGHAVTLDAPGALALSDADSIALAASSGGRLAVTASDVAILGTLDLGNGDASFINRAGDLVTLGSATADSSGSTFELTDGELALINAGRIAASTAGTPTEGIAVQGVALDAESLTLDAGVGPVVFDTAATSVAGDLTVTAGSIDQDANGALAVAGRTRLTASNAIALGNSQNDFDSNAPAPDAVDEVDANGTSVVLADRDAIALGRVTASSLEVRSEGSITDTSGKSIEVTGAAEFVALRLIDGFDIRLDNDGASDRHDFGGPIDAVGEDIWITNGGTLTRLGLIRPLDDAANPFTATIDATINNGNDGDLTVLSLGGPIVDGPGGSIIVPGATTLAAAGGGDFYDIMLAETGAHDFSEVDLLNASGADISINDRDGIQLGGISARGDLSVEAGGSITDARGSAIIVSGATDLIAQEGSNLFDIALDGDGTVPFDLPHDFGGAVSARGEDIILHDRDGIVLGTIDANESGQDADTAAADNTIAFYDRDGDGMLKATDRGAAGDLTVRAGGAITDTGAPIDVEGRTRLEARSGATLFDIRLDGDDGEASDRPHDFDSNAALAGGTAGDAAQRVDALGRNIMLVDKNAIVLGDIDASGDLSLVAGGSITDTPDGAVIVDGLTTIRATDQDGENFFDVVLDNGLHDLNRIDLTGEGIQIIDRQDLTILRVASRAGDTADPTLPSDGISLTVNAGDFNLNGALTATPLDAVQDVMLHAPEGTFKDGRLRDGLTFRSELGGIILDLKEGFVVQDEPGTDPFTLDAPRGISRIRIGAAGEPEFFGIGTAGFLDQARQPDFNPFFNSAPVGDVDLFRVTGGFALVARSPLTVRFQNTLSIANTGAGTVIDGTTYLGGAFAGISLFGSFGGVEGTISALEGFRDAARIGELPYSIDNANTANGCAILVPSACQPIGSLLPSLTFRDGLLLGIRFVDPAEDLDDPFTNRGDEEEWE